MRWPFVQEHPVVGWETIWRTLFHAQNKHGQPVPIMSLYTLRQYRRDELMAYGACFVIHVGPLRHARVCAWPSKVREWMQGLPPDDPKAERPEELALQGWATIHQLFHMHDGQGLVPMFSMRTLRDKHAGELKELSCIFKFTDGRVYGWPSMIRAWIQLKAKHGEL